ncbi:MAG: hypothetical protein GX846_00210 [Deltaproteobacteria bacterium]|nr:hypothetical protein [Deltaproteobacteria bacterium]
MSKIKLPHLLVVLILFLFIFGMPTKAVLASGNPKTVELGGGFDDPLLIKIQNDGLIGVFVKDEYDFTNTYNARYYDDLCSSTIIYFKLDEQDYVVLSDLHTNSLSFENSISLQLESGSQILNDCSAKMKTTWVYPGLLQFEQEVSYKPGSHQIEKTFHITSGAQISDLKLIHSVDLRRISILNLKGDGTGFLIKEDDFINSWQVKFYPAISTPWQSFYCGSSTQAWEEIQTGVLSNTVSEAAYLTVLASWEKEELEPGGTWSVSTFEDYTPELFSDDPEPTKEPEPTQVITNSNTPTSQGPAGTAPTVLEPTKTEKHPGVSAGSEGTGPVVSGASKPTSIVETSSYGAVSDKEATPTGSDPDQFEEFIKTGEYYAITFAILLLVTAVILIVARIRLVKGAK